MLASSVRTFSVHLENLISVTCFASSFTLEKHQRLYRSWICAKSRFWSIFFPWKLWKFSTSTNYGFLSPNLFSSFRESDLSNLLFDCKINLRDVKFEKIETQLRWIGERTGTPPWQPASRPAFFFFFCRKGNGKSKSFGPYLFQSSLLWGFICMYAHVKPLHGEAGTLTSLLYQNGRLCNTPHTSSCFLSISISLD